MVGVFDAVGDFVDCFVTVRLPVAARVGDFFDWALAGTAVASPPGTYTGPDRGWVGVASRVGVAVDNGTVVGVRVGVRVGVAVGSGVGVSVGSGVSVGVGVSVARLAAYATGA